MVILSGLITLITLLGCFKLLLRQSLEILLGEVIDPELLTVRHDLTPVVLSSVSG
jgi:hypothetical protein